MELTSSFVDKPVDNPVPMWDILKERLKEKVGPNTYNIWFTQISGGKIDGDDLVIAVPSKFIANWLTDYYVDLIQQESSELAQKPIKVQFDIQEEEREKRGVASRGFLQPKVPLQIKIVHPLNPKYTFENFVVGNGNQLAHAAARAVSELPGAHYNPLFIYGGVGLGKTHLLHAVGIEALRRRPELKIVSLSAEKFMNEFINSVRNNQMELFRKKYRTTVDILLIDDIPFLGGKESTQEEFFHTFNELHNTHRQIVVTSDKMPKEIPGLEERLRSRFEWGLIADIQAPDFETRVAIIRKKIATDKIFLNDEAALFLAETVRSNVRELEGTLIRLNAFASLTKSPITVSLIKELLQNQFKGQEAKKKTTVESIQQIVAEYYRLSSEELKSPRRHKGLSYPRHVAMYLCKKHLNLSFPEIGRRFGGKDHTTVLHAVRKIESLLEIDANLQSDVAILEKTIV